MDTSEKIYFFDLDKGGGVHETLRVPESQLSQAQKDLLLGDAIKQFLNLPEQLQHQFFLSLKATPNNARA